MYCHGDGSHLATSPTPAPAYFLCCWQISFSGNFSSPMSPRHISSISKKLAWKTTCSCVFDLVLSRLKDIKWSPTHIPSTFKTCEKGRERGDRKDSWLQRQNSGKNDPAQQLDYWISIPVCLSKLCLQHPNFFVLPPTLLPVLSFLPSCCQCSVLKAQARILDRLSDDRIISPDIRD